MAFFYIKAFLLLFICTNFLYHFIFIVYWKIIKVIILLLLFSHFFLIHLYSFLLSVFSLVFSIKKFGAVLLIQNFVSNENGIIWNNFLFCLLYNFFLSQRYWVFALNRLIFNENLNGAVILIRFESCQTIFLGNHNLRLSTFDQLMHFYINLAEV